MCQLISLLWKANRLYCKEVEILPSQWRLQYSLLVMAWGQGFVWLALSVVVFVAEFLFKSVYFFISSQYLLRFWFMFLKQGSEMVQFTLVPLAFPISLQGLLHFSEICFFIYLWILAPRKHFCDHSFMPWNVQSARNLIISSSCAPSPKDMQSVEINKG